MLQRGLENRIQKLRQSSDRRARDLERDRVFIDRKVKDLQLQIQKCLCKGDQHSARLLARQIVYLEQLACRNLGAQLSMERSAKKIVSNHKINKATLDTIKEVVGLHRNSELKKTLLGEKQLKMLQKIDLISTQEESWNESIDEICEFQWDQSIQSDSRTESEVEAILLRELRKVEKNSPIKKNDSMSSKIQLVFKRFQDKDDISFTLDIETLDLSVAMLRHLLESNTQGMQQLGLNENGICSLKYFDIGMISEAGGFVALPIDASLKEIGIMNHDVLYVA